MIHESTFELIIQAVVVESGLEDNKEGEVGTMRTASALCCREASTGAGLLVELEP
jgi:hypothetical protein